MVKPSLDLRPQSTERRSRRREPRPEPVPPPVAWKIMEARRAGAVVGELAHAVEHEVHDLLADGVVATGVLVGGVLLAGDDSPRRRTVSSRST
jgi:hypothetical protein